MRDPRRIQEIIPLLQAAWETSPDLRLGQLMCNLSHLYNGIIDPFNLEDQLLIAIQKFNEKHT